MNNTSRKILGYAMLAFPFVTLFLLTAAITSFKLAAVVFLASTGIAVLVTFCTIWGNKILDSVPKK